MKKRWFWIESYKIEKLLKEGTIKHCSKTEKQWGKDKQWLLEKICDYLEPLFAEKLLNDIVKRFRFEKMKSL